MRTFVLILVVFFFLLFFFVSSHHVSAKFHLWPSSDDHPSVPVAQRIETWSLYGSRWALSEDSSFNSHSSWPEVYLVKNVVRLTTTMEGSNYWGYGYKTQHSYSRSRLITWRRPEVKFGRNVVKEETKQKLPRWGQKVRNK